MWKCLNICSFTIQVPGHTGPNSNEWSRNASTLNLKDTSTHEALSGGWPQRRHPSQPSTCKTPRHWQPWLHLQWGAAQEKTRGRTRQPERIPAFHRSKGDWAAFEIFSWIILYKFPDTVLHIMLIPVSVHSYLYYTTMQCIVCPTHIPLFNSTILAPRWTNYG